MSFFSSKVQSEAARTTTESAKHVEEVCINEAAWLVENYCINLVSMTGKELYERRNDVRIRGLKETHSADYWVGYKENAVEIYTGLFTALFINMRTLNSKLNRQLRFSLPSIKCWAVHPSFRLRPTSGNQVVEHSSDNETVLGSSRKLGGAVGCLIDGSEKRSCRLSFEF